MWKGKRRRKSPCNILTKCYQPGTKPPLHDGGNDGGHEYLAFGAEVGQKILSGERPLAESISVTVGRFYSGNKASLLVLKPLLKRMEGGSPYYTMARFTLDSEQNRRLETLCQMSQEIVETPGTGLQELLFLLWRCAVISGAAASCIRPAARPFSPRSLLRRHRRGNHSKLRRRP